MLLPALSYLECISQSLVAIRWSHTHTSPSSPPLTIFHSSICTADTPSWWPYMEHTAWAERRSNTLTLQDRRNGVKQGKNGEKQGETGKTRGKQGETG